MWRQFRGDEDHSRWINRPMFDLTSVSVWEEPEGVWKRATG